MTTSLNVIEFEQRHDGKPLQLYSGVMTADDLIECAHIPSYDSAADTGYQRPVNSSRLAKIAAYVLNKGGLMPTSILVNIRDGATYVNNGKNSRTGVLTFPEGRVLEVMDGQHRVAGLRMAKERKYPLPYSVPVVFTIGLDEYNEGQLFLVVNKEQKSVPTDMTAELLRKRISKDASEGKPGVKITDTELRGMISIEIVRALAKDPDGVWFEKIQMADEIKQYQKPIRLATLARTLEPFLQGDWAHNLVKTRQQKPLFEAVSNYWKGLAILMPQAIGDPKNYSVQGPTAGWVWGYVLKDYARFADKADDWSPEFFAKELKKLEEWVDAETWHRERGHQLTRAKGAGLARLIMEELAPLYRPELLEAAE